MDVMLSVREVTSSNLMDYTIHASPNECGEVITDANVWSGRIACKAQGIPPDPMTMTLEPQMCSHRCILEPRASNTSITLFVILDSTLVKK
jgi:hypothetical protein